MLKIYLRLGHKGRHILRSDRPKSKAPSIYTIQMNVLQRMIIVINFKYLV